MTRSLKLVNTSNHKGESYRVVYSAHGTEHEVVIDAGESTFIDGYAEKIVLQRGESDKTEPFFKDVITETGTRQMKQVSPRVRVTLE